MLTEARLGQAQITRLENALHDLRAHNTKILSPLLTEYALQSEERARLGIFLDYLHSMK